MKHAIGYLRVSMCEQGRGIGQAAQRFDIERFSARKEFTKIRAIWKQHPEFTARQAIEEPGPENRLRIPCVQQVMRKCWRTSAQAQHSPKRWLLGRRIYHSLARS